jgi:phage shock protein A
MNDLFKKLNTLVKAGINDALSDLSARVPRRGDPVGGPDFERDISELRQRINDGISYETRLQERVQALEAEIERLDRRADEAVTEGNDALARHFIEHMKRAEQHLDMARSDLELHQLALQDLIQRVNLLEARVAEVRRAETQSQAAEQAASSRASETGTDEAVEDDRTDTEEESPVIVVTDLLREAREKMQTDTKHEADMTRLKDEPPADNTAIEDDLTARRQRLSR